MAATKSGAQIMGMSEQTGLIRSGFLADIILVDGDPSQDVTILQDKHKLIAVMKEGKFYKRANC
jgi:imidazolonepropionase-like amidohydrolase